MKIYATVRRRQLVAEQRKYKEKFDQRKFEYNRQYFNYQDAIDNWANTITDYLLHNVTNDAAAVEVFSHSRDYKRIPGALIELSNRYCIITIWQPLDEDVDIIVDTNIKTHISDDIKFEIGQCAILIQNILDFDWQDFLVNQYPIPRIESFVNIQDPWTDPEYADPGYDKMILDEDIIDSIGKDLWWPSYHGYIQFIGYDDNEYKYRVFETGFPEFSIAKSDISALRLSASRDYETTEEVHERYPYVSLEGL